MEYTLEMWLLDNGMYLDDLLESGILLDSVQPAVCEHGCDVEPDGHCEHDCPSISLALGII